MARTPDHRLLRHDRPKRDSSRRGRDRPRRERPDKEDHKLVHVAGLAAVLALFKTAPERIERLFFEEHLKSATGPICLDLAKRHRPYRIVRDEELTRIAATAMHGGIVALASPRPVLAFDTAEATDWARSGEPLLVLDGIGNPHNLGAIARTAAFFGLNRLVVSAHREQALPSDAAYRVARGGLEHVAVYKAERLADSLRRLRKDYLVLGAGLEKGKPPSAFVASGRPFLLVLGNEEEGLARATLEQCEAIVTIPGSGRVQSLNVAAAAAILIDTLLVRRTA